MFMLGVFMNVCMFILCGLPGLLEWIVLQRVYVSLGYLVPSRGRRPLVIGMIRLHQQ